MYRLFITLNLIGLIVALGVATVCTILQALHLDGVISFNLSEYKEELKYLCIFLGCAPTLIFIFLVASCFKKTKKELKPK